MDESEVDLLRESIEAIGQTDPVHLETLGGGRYLTTEGNKRVKAIQQSKKVQFVNAIVSDKLSPEDRLLKQVVIDSHRSNFPLDARDSAWKKLWDMGKYTPQTFAKKLSVTEIMVKSFIDRTSLGLDFVKSIPNVSAYNITETQTIKDVPTRKRVLKFAHKTELTRKGIRQLSSVANRVTPKILNEVLDEKITVADAENMIGLKAEDQDRALITTKVLNTHKKKLKTMLKDGSIFEENVKEVRQVGELIHAFQMEFFTTSSKIRQLSSKLQWLKDEDLDKYVNTQMKEILEGCLDELEESVMPAIKMIRTNISGIRVKQIEGGKRK
jgi:hypothetical protein